MTAAAEAGSALQRTRKGRVLLLTIDRPESRNALTPALMGALAAALAAADRDGDIGASVIAGRGGLFSAGADVSAFAQENPAGYLAGPMRAAFDAVRRAGKPVIAAVRGWCLGGGCELALACDLILAGDDAMFGQPEIRLGIIPGAGGTVAWAPRTGAGPQAEAALTGRMIDAWEARRIGLADAVVPSEAVVHHALARAAAIAAQAPLAVHAAKAAMRSATRMPLAAALDHEVSLMAGLLGTDDAAEGARAFRDKRPPVFRGC